MPSSKQYRAQADELRSKARFTENRETAAEWTRLAKFYLRLADEADRNATTDLVYEPPPPKLSGETE